MTIYDPTATRLQLLRNGYFPVPNRCKITEPKGWNGDDFLNHNLKDGFRGRSAAQHIESWRNRYPDARSTGIRIQGGLVNIDVDCTDADLVEEFLAKLEAIAPDVATRSPTRYGGGNGVKLTLLARIADNQDKWKLRSQRWRPPGEETGHHVLEIFLSQAGTTQCKHQVGAYGPHTVDRDGNVVVSYRWDEGLSTPLEIRPEGLPEVTLTQINAMRDAFNALAAAAGWETLSESLEAEDAAFVFDLTDATLFDMADGTTRSYAQVCAVYSPHIEMRCSDSWRGGSGIHRSKCLFGEIKVLGGVVGLWDFEDNCWHAPVGPDLDALGVRLKKLAEDMGVHQIGTPAWREKYADGRPKASLHNAMAAITALDIACSQDAFVGQAYMGRGSAAPPLAPLELFFGHVTDASTRALRAFLSKTFGFDMTEKHVNDGVMTLCEANRFNPITDMLAEAEAGWDGVERLDRMAVDFFNTEDTELNRAFVRKTMIAAVARARDPGCKFDFILTMESKEGWNKSSAWVVLAGEPYFSDEPIIGQHGKEVQEALGGVWIHENSELTGMTKREVGAVKAFASRRVDSARPAYGRHLVRQARHSIEVATINDTAYLLSMSGNRRFWPITILAPIDLARLRQFRLQLWGEAASCYSAGETPDLPVHLYAAANDAQEARVVRDPWEAKLAGMMHVTNSGPMAGLAEHDGHVIHRVGDEDRVFTLAVFDYILKIPMAQLHQQHSRRLADIMRRLGWESDFIRVGTRGPQRGYSRKIGNRV